MIYQRYETTRELQPREKPSKTRYHSSPPPPSCEWTWTATTTTTTATKKTNETKRTKQLNPTSFGAGIVWFRWRGWDYTLKRATMMIRPRYYIKEAASTPNPWATPPLRLAETRPPTIKTTTTTTTTNSNQLSHTPARRRNTPPHDPKKKTNKICWGRGQFWAFLGTCRNKKKHSNHLLLLHPHPMHIRNARSLPFPVFSVSN